MEDLLRVGVIANTHGIKGEVKVYPTTDDPNRFLDLKEVILDAGREKLTLEVQNVRFFKNMVIVKFKGIDNINDIEKYKGKDLLVTRENAVPLEEGEYFIADLLDMDVYEESGEKLGVLLDVLQTGANDVYVVKRDKDGKEILIPGIDECILDINLEENKITVHLLEGLVDE
jgi:16S rRNA processing protein RimM